MNKASISRRNFMKVVLSSTAFLPLQGYRLRGYQRENASSEKQIDWGYPQGAIRLNSNENPLGPSPLAISAMEKALSFAHRYSTPNQLLKELASFHQVPQDTVLAGCGSTEFLKIAPWTFLREGGELIISLQTYKTLGREAEKIGAKVKWVPLRKDFTPDLDSMRKAITSKTKMIYLANPNNPTGTFLSFEDVKKFCSSLPAEIIVFIDEAYSHFLEDAKDGITLVKEGYNVIISRTFSKAYGLAGMRLGYVISKPSIIKALEAFGFRDMGINQAVYAAAVNSLEDENHIQNYKKLMKEEREFYSQQFRSMGLEYIMGIAPFLMVKVTTDSKALQKKLARRHVFVRKGEDWQMPGYLRISIGLPEENRACIRALKETLNI